MTRVVTLVDSPLFGFHLDLATDRPEELARGIEDLGRAAEAPAGLVKFRPDLPAGRHDRHPRLGGSHEFDSQIDVTAERDGTYAADLSAGWLVGGGVNGGYLLAVIGNALRRPCPGSRTRSRSVPTTCPPRRRVRRR